MSTSEYSPVCPYCGHTTIYKPKGWVVGGPLACANPFCETNYPEEEDQLPGLHECPHCHYRFEDAESLDRHLNEDGGCPEESHG